MTPKRVGIVGANGYSGRELCTLLAHHSGANIVALCSRQHAGETLSQVLPRFAKRSQFANLYFSTPSVSNLLNAGVETVFLALPHGIAAEFVVPLLDVGVRVIDLSADFRLLHAEMYEESYGKKHPAPHLLTEAVYGLPEWRGDVIRSARLVACPGCYPTSILLPLTPLFAENLLTTDALCISSASGISGAGRQPEISLLFGECDESFRAYGIPQHRHLAEIEQGIFFSAGEEISISFVPHLIPAHRGIHTTIFATPREGVGVAQVQQIWREKYHKSPFVRISDTLPDIKNVNMTNFCDLAVRLDERGEKLLLFSVIDNLVKGAAGQAIQCFNIMNGFAEAEGLLS